MISLVRFIRRRHASALAAVSLFLIVIFVTENRQTRLVRISTRSFSIFISRSSPLTRLSQVSAPKCDTFVCAMNARASADKLIVLSAIDTAFIDMAINFHDSSLQPHDIENFLFVGIGDGTCHSLETAMPSLPCFQYGKAGTHNSSSVYRSSEFMNKMLIRIDMLLEALSAGFTVLLTDVDLYFKKNPLSDLELTVETADMAAMWDSKVFNAGFTITRPTQQSIDIWNATRKLVSFENRIDDQVALNKVVNETLSTSFKLVKLEPSRYACGKEYFEDSERWFTDCCATHDVTWVVHNNFIVSYEAKVYRFKEHLMWTRDTGGYYSSSASYMRYDNPVMTSWSPAELNSSVIHQLEALQAALAIGSILNRVVILPKFHCIRATKDAYFECPLNALIAIKNFDSQFGSFYRESSFLRNKKVPQDVAQNVTLRIDVVPVRSSKKSSKTSVSSKQEVTSEALLKRFKPVTERVLSLGMLYNVRVNFMSAWATHSFESAVKLGFIHFQSFSVTNYRQASLLPVQKKIKH